jgi:voltage-gated potassium channel Kch
MSDKPHTPSKAGLALRVSLFLLLTIFCLGFYGYRQTFIRHERAFDFWTVCSHTAELLRSTPVIFVEGKKLDSHWALKTAQGMARIWVYAAGIAWGIIFFGDQLSVWFFRKARGHSVFIGLGWSGRILALAAAQRKRVSEVARETKARDRSLIAGTATGKALDQIRSGRQLRVATIDVDAANESISILKSKKALVLTGSGMDPAVLGAARVPTAGKVHILTGDDYLNARIASSVMEEWEMFFRPPADKTSFLGGMKRGVMRFWEAIFGREQPPDSQEILVSISSPELRSLLQDRWTRIGSGNRKLPLVRILGFQSLAIRSVLADVAGQLICNAEVRDHGARILVGGDPVFIREFLDLAVMFFQISGLNRPRFWIFGASSQAESFKRQYPSVDLIADIQFVDTCAADIGMCQQLAGHGYHAAFIRLENEAVTLAAAHRAATSPFFEVGDVRAFVWRKPEIEIEIDPGERLKMHAILEEACYLLEGGFLELEKKARAQHDAYLKELGPEEVETRKKAGKDPSWESLRESLKESNRLGVLHGQIKSKVWEQTREASAQERSALEEHLAHSEHGRWMAEKAMQGFVFGPKRDDTRKIHPSMVPWEKLSESEKEKDRVQVRKVLKEFQSPSS